jgi:dCTP deaminase
VDEDMVAQPARIFSSTSGLPDLPDLFGEEDERLPGGQIPSATDLGTRIGLLPRQRIRQMVHRKMISAAGGLEESQFQPASLDLRLGQKGYRIRASFLPGKSRSVADNLLQLTHDEISLDHGVVLEKGCVYLIELQEVLQLQDSISAIANPKSSTGRLDIFTRLIADNSAVFDRVGGGYAGRLYAEVSPRSFSVRVRKGSRLLQLRFRRRNSQQTESGVFFRIRDRQLQKMHDAAPLVIDGKLQLRNGLLISVNLQGDGPSSIVGYKAQSDTSVIDVEEIGKYDPMDFWEPIHVRKQRQLILAPHQFYILASKQRIRIPGELAAEMVPIDPTMGEFRVHYAGFFDPGFGDMEHGPCGSRAVLEVRSHEVPFILEDDQAIGRLVYERLAEPPDLLYGRNKTSNYQGQGLKLSKHFQM